MYQDDPTIRFCGVPHDVPIEHVAQKLPDHVIIACGVPASQGAHEYPDSFYSGANLPVDARTKYFHHAHSHESEILSWELTEPFVMIHDSKSSSEFDLSKVVDPDRQLVINIGRNVYPVGHKYHAVADKFVGRPLHCYIHALSRADELHLVESSLACLAIHLDLSSVKIKKAYKASSNFINLEVFEEGLI